MFAPRPYDGIVPVPYSRKGIAVRAVVPGGPADRAGIRAGDCVLGIGKRMVDSSSDASAELRKHAIGETVPYIYRRGPCTAEATSDLPIVPVRLSSERLGGTTYLYAAALGFLFFFIGFFVFRRRPEDGSARIFFLLCVLFLLFFVCRPPFIASTRRLPTEPKNIRELSLARRATMSREGVNTRVTLSFPNESGASAPSRTLTSSSAIFG